MQAVKLTLLVIIIVTLIIKEPILILHRVN